MTINTVPSILFYLLFTEQMKQGVMSGTIKLMEVPTPVSVAFERGVLSLNGHPQFLLSADYPYYRDDVANWRPRLQQLKGLGISSVTFYVPWRHHEVGSGFDFTGRTQPNRNVVHFLELIQQEGLMAIVKPGPFIHAETDFGGLLDEVTNWIGVVSHNEDCFNRYLLLCKRQPGPNLEENWGFAKLYDFRYRHTVIPFFQTVLAIAAGRPGSTSTPVSAPTPGMRTSTHAGTPLPRLRADRAGRRHHYFVLSTAAEPAVHRAGPVAVQLPGRSAAIIRVADGRLTDALIKGVNDCDGNSAP